MQQKGEFKLNFLLLESSKLWSIHHIALFLSQNKMSIIKCAVGIWHAKVNHALMVSSDLSKRRGSLLRWNIIWKKKFGKLETFLFWLTGENLRVSSRQWTSKDFFVETEFRFLTLWTLWRLSTKTSNQRLNRPQKWCSQLNTFFQKNIS